MRVKCFAQEHNTMSPARARTQTARFGVERTNHETIVPPASLLKLQKNYEIARDCLSCMLEFTVMQS